MKSEIPVNYRWGRLVVLLFLGSLMEFLSLSLIFSYLNLIQKPEFLTQIETWAAVVNITLTGGLSQWILVLTVFIIGAYVVKTAVYILVQVIIIHIQQTILKEMRLKVFDAYMSLPYSFYLNKNAADFIQSMYRDVDAYNAGVVQNRLAIISEGIYVAIILISLILLNPTLILLFGGLSALLGGFFYLTKKKVVEIGKIGSKAGDMVAETFMQAFVSFIFAKLYSLKNFYHNKIEESMNQTIWSSVRFYGINMIPKALIENVVVVGILGLVMYQLGTGASAGDTIAFVGTLGLASVRLMPSLTKFSNAISGIKNAEVYRDRLIRLFAAGNEARDTGDTGIPSEPWKWQKEIRISGVSFTYPEADKPALKNVSLTMNRGQVIGLIGPSGSGKTTLAGLVLGLLQPTEGSIDVDGRPIQEDLPSWYAGIGYVPQITALVDDTIENNIILGRNLPGEKGARLDRVIKAAHLADVVEGQPQGVATAIGEGGARISGGQRQRLGIARALYHDPGFLVFDEATSALDTGTEEIINDSIREVGRDKTVLVIAHRYSSLKYCDRIYELKEGKVVREVTYSELMSQGESPV